MLEFSAFVAALGALSLTTTKVVDLIRNVFDKQGRLVGSWVWNVVAFGVGIAFCLGWQMNLGPQLLTLVPALSDHASALSGVSGQVLTGVLVGGSAGFWHELLSALSSVQAKNEAVAARVDPVVDTVYEQEV
jgi:hypothetical protein